MLIALASAWDTQISRYRQAPVAFERWIALAGQVPPSLDRAGKLATVAEDLLTGAAATVTSETRVALAARAQAVLAEPAWAAMLGQYAASGDPVQARRAAWVTASRDRPRDPSRRFAVEITVADPDQRPHVEARVLIDGLPVPAAAFGNGPALEPEALLATGRFRASAEPADVKLAEAPCTEGCCGALYVTIAREGDTVTWRNWRSAGQPASLPEYRFTAADYDREVARAEQDHAWEWPARTAARLIGDQIRADPSLLGRWDCQPGWCASSRDFTTVRLSFTYPAGATTEEDPWVQFGLSVDVGNSSPETKAAEVVEALRTTDPKESAEIIGGTRNAAARLGLPHRKPTRR
jgi:hypothetical protein